MTSQTYSITPAQLEQFLSAVEADKECTLQVITWSNHVGCVGLPAEGTLDVKTIVGDVKLGYTYDGPSTLTVTIQHKPFLVSEGTVFDRVAQLIASAPAAGSATLPGTTQAEGQSASAGE